MIYHKRKKLPVNIREIWPALIAAGGAIAGGAISSSGSAKQNQANIEQSQKQMDFQRMMSNTAFQRSSRDLQKAGLNRIIALGSPATTPTGAKAQIENQLKGLGDGVASAASSAMTLRKQDADTKLVNEQTLNATSQRKLINAQALKTSMDAITSAKGAEISKSVTPFITDIRKMLDLIIQDFHQDISKDTVLTKLGKDQVKSKKKSKPEPGLSKYNPMRYTPAYQLYKNTR